MGRLWDTSWENPKDILRTGMVMLLPSLSPRIIVSFPPNPPITPHYSPFTNLSGRLGLAATLMKFLEDVSNKKMAFFVDLFVRVSNKIAINMYSNLGYIIYRTVLDYYSGDPDEDAFDMRKSLARDEYKKAMIPLSHPVVRSDEVE